MKEFNRYIPGNNSLLINEEKLFIVWVQQLPGLCCAVEAAAGSSSLGLSNIWYIGPGSGSWKQFSVATVCGEKKQQVDRRSLSENYK